MKVILEYNENNKGEFHYTYLDNTGNLMTPLFQYGMKPICVLDKEYVTKKEFIIFLDSLSYKRYSYEKVCSEILMKILKEDRYGISK